MGSANRALMFILRGYPPCIGTRLHEFASTIHLSLLQMHDQLRDDPVRYALTNSLSPILNLGPYELILTFLSLFALQFTTEGDTSQ